MSKIELLQNWVKEAHNIVVMTGAGFSVPSGIPDFRSEGGLYETKDQSYSPEVILSHRFFFKHTNEFYDFYRLKMIYPDAKPNIAHYTIARLEELGKNVTIITQNIDGLHQLAGSKDVVELHGSVHRNYCVKCNHYYSLEDLLKQDNVPLCECGGIIKPDVVLYEESLNQQDLLRSVDLIGKTDLLIVAGTSLNVHPAASLVNYYHGNRFVIINLSTTPYDRYANCVINKPLEKVLCDKYF